MLALNQSNRTPRFSVSRFIVHLSCAYRPPSPSTLPVVKVGHSLLESKLVVGTVTLPLTVRATGSMQPSLLRLRPIGTGIPRPFPLVANVLTTRPYGTTDPVQAPRSAHEKSMPVL